MKSTKIEIENRVTEIISLIIQGNNSNEIVHFISAKYHITERQVRDYIKKAYDFMAKDAITERKHILALQNARLEKLYNSCIQVVKEEAREEETGEKPDAKKAFSIYNYRASQKGIALGALKEMNKINGLHVERMQIDMKYSKLDSFLDGLQEVAKEGSNE